MGKCDVCGCDKAEKWLCIVCKYILQANISDACQILEEMLSEEQGQ